MFLVSLVGEKETQLFSLCGEQSALICLLVIIFRTSIIFSLKTRNSNVIPISKFLIFPFLVNFFGRITLFLFKQVSKKLGVLRNTRNFFSPPELLDLYWGVLRLRIEQASHIRGDCLRINLQYKVSSSAFSLIDSPTLRTLFNLLLAVL